VGHGWCPLGAWAISAFGASGQTESVRTPSFAWCIPDSADRVQRLPEFFGIVFDAVLRLGHCYYTSDGAAASLWLPPGVEPLTEEQ